LRIAVGVVVLLATLGSRPAAGADAHAALGSLVEGYWQEALALDPLGATVVGEHRYDDQLPNDIGIAHIARRLDLERRSLLGLAAIDSSQLSGEDATTWETFREDRLTALEGFRYQAELLPLDGIDSLPLRMAEFGSGGDAQPFRTAQDYESWLRRVAGLGPWITQAIANLRRGAAKGIVAPRADAERMVAELEALIPVDPAASVFYRPVSAFPAGVGLGAQAHLRIVYLAAIRERINPAYRRLYEFLRGEYLPSTRATIGRGALPLGREWYAYEVRRRTSSDLEPAAIHALGLAEVARLAAELDRAIADTGFHGERRAFVDSLAADPRLHYAAADELLSAYRGLKDTVRAHLPALFDLAPRADFTIVPVDGALLERAAAGGAAPAGADGARPGVLRLATSPLADQPRYDADATYLREAEPGRRFQRALALERTQLPSFRRFGEHAAYVEGWNLYAVSLGRELGLVTDPYAAFGALSMELTSAAMLVVDTGIHARGWTQRQAIDYLLANTALTAAAAARQVERSVAAPGLALAATLGVLRIRELRTRAERELGSRFDVRAFHRAVLESGSVPLPVLDARVGAFIARAKVAP
jgi:uncharacterized protein (DUF885 family)